MLGYGTDGRHIHFLWVSRPLKRDWMNTALCNSFMLQEEVIPNSHPCPTPPSNDPTQSFLILEDGWVDPSSRKVLFFLTTPSCYILFVCCRETLQTNSCALHPFLTRVRPHLNLRIWVRLWITVYKFSSGSANSVVTCTQKKDQ